MHATELNRLRWRCRRGMLELDMLLQRFLVAYGAQLSPEMARQLVELLEWPDPELWAMLSGAAPPPVPLAALVSQIRATGSS